MKTTFAGGLGIAVMAMASASSVAYAEGQETDSFGTLTANLGIASEYVFRGVPRTDGTQLSASIDWNYNNLYVGTWLSNSDEDFEGNRFSAQRVEGTEVSLYAGMTMGDFDVGAIAYGFPADKVDPDFIGIDGSVRNTKRLEVYTGYNHGVFSGYAYYGVGAYGRSNDDYVYLDGNITVPAGEKAELSFHVGYTMYHGDDFDRGVVPDPITGAGYRDQQVDLGLTLRVGGLWFGMTSVLENDSAIKGFKRDDLERPRINVGYNWTFDDLMPVRLRF